MDRNESCKDRVYEHLASRLDDLRQLWAGHTGAECTNCGGETEIEIIDEDAFPRTNEWIECPGCEGTGITPEDNPDLGNMYEYGLSFDYVAPETLNEQPEGYFRYQLSWGGPSDEFRIYAQRVGEYRYSVSRIEYWLLDWFDGAHIVLERDSLALISEIFESFFVEVGSADHEFQKALEEVQL